MLHTAEAFVKKHNMLEKEETVLIGVSGGIDSLVLLHLFLQWREKWNLTIIVVHVDHMLRADSQADMEYVKAICQQYNVSCEAEQIDVSDYMETHKKTLQEAARICRYEFFSTIMKKYSATKLALAHHGDDQIETILMRLTRGSNAKGYTGIQAVRPFEHGKIIRPLLSLSKQDLRMYAKKYTLQPKEDPTNAKDTYTRNRFRHYVLSFLQVEQANVHEKFQQFSELLTEDEQFLQELMLRELNNVIEQAIDITVDTKKFCDMPRPLQRRMIQLILSYLYKNCVQIVNLTHINNLLSLIHHNHPSGEQHLPNGLLVYRSYGKCVFTFQKKKLLTYDYELSIPGEVQLPNGDKIIAAFEQTISQMTLNNDTILMPKANHPLFRVRTRIAGDFLQLKNGRKKLKTIFIDEKVPRDKRDTFPVVEDSSGEIIWLPGLKKSVNEEIQEETCIMLKYIRL